MAILELDGLALRDERFDLLGDLTGRGKFDARARVELLWYDCIEKTQDVLSTERIDILAGWFDTDRGHFADMMVRAKLADPVPDDSKQMLGLYRVRGVKERMNWLVELREKRKLAASAGGKKTAESAARGSDGRFLGQDTQANSKQMLGDAPSTDPSKTKQNQANPSGTVTVTGTNPEKKKKNTPARTRGGLRLPDLAELWNEVADPALPRVAEMGPKTKRRSACEARWAENPDREYWKGVITRINGSKGCLGANDTGWRADIDFLSRPDTAAKVLEGKYDKWGQERNAGLARRPIGGHERKGASADDEIRKIMSGDMDGQEGSDAAAH